MAKPRIAHVIPIIKLPKKFDFFDYRVPDGMTVVPGQIVNVPFRKSHIYALVWNVDEKSEITLRKTKEIKNIAYENFLALHHLKLIEWMSEYYFHSPSLIVRSILPKIPKQKKIISEHSEITLPPKKAEIKNKTSVKYFQKNDKVLFIGNIHEFALETTRKNMKNNEQTLVLFPEFGLAENFFQKLSESLVGANALLISGSLTKSQWYEYWIQTLSGKADVIIGTRSAVFFPFASLGAIVIAQEENENHKQWDQNPRYNAKDVALKISELTSSPIALGSVAPLITTYSKTLKDFTLAQEDDFPVAEYEIADMRDEKHYKNFSPISSRVQSILRETDTPILLVVQKKGYSTSVLCADCGSVSECPKCHNTLRYYDDRPGENLACHFCGFRQTLDASCKKCRGTRYKFVGSGTQKVANELKKYIPDNAFARIDSDAINEDFDSIYSDFCAKKIRAIVATPAFLDSMLFKKHPDMHAALISADALLSIPDIFAAEKLWQTLRKILYVSKTATIQTYKPEHDIFSRLSDMHAFYLSELRKRKEFSYPPYSRLIKIITQSPNSETADSDSQSVLSAIQEKIQDIPDITAFGPITPYEEKIRGSYRRHILVKLLKRTSDASSVVFALPNSVLVDVDPIQVL